MNNYQLDPKIINLATEEQIEVLQEYSVLAQQFSLIPVWPQSKVPVETGWTKWCSIKKPFNPLNFVNINGNKLELKNAGIACGPASDVIIVDIDNHGEFIAWAANKGIKKPLPKTFTVESGKKGFHLYYKYIQCNGYEFKSKRIKGIFDILCLGSQAVAPGSIHPDTGKTYKIVKPVPIVPLPEWIINYLKGESLQGKKHDPKTNQNCNYNNAIAEGERNSTLCSLAGTMRKDGAEQAEIEAALIVANSNRCNPPLSEEEVRDIAASIMRYPAGTKYQFSEVGNAQRMIDLFGENLKYCTQDERWYIWDGYVWKQDDKNQIIEYAKKTINHIFEEAKSISNKDTRAQLINHGKKSDNALQIKNLIFLAQSDPVVIISLHKLDQQPMLLNCLNGTVDLTTGYFRSHDRSDLMTQMIPVDYDITARCPKFIEFINQIMGNDADLIDYLQKIFGYTLTGDTSEQCYFIFYGGGSNGKSTLINVFSTLMDQYSKAITFNTLTTENNRARNDLARLAGSRMVSSVEVDLQQCFNESVVNRITGGDKIVASFKYKEFFEFTPEFKLFVVGNHLPRIEQQNHATWRRIRLIPFNVRFALTEEGKKLPSKLLQELPGILNWAIAGCLQWQREGLNPPEAVKAAVTEYRKEMDSIAGFMEEACEIGTSFSKPSKDMYQAYQNWCTENGERIIGKKDFTKAMGQKGFEKKKLKGGEHWIGIQLKTENNS